MCDKASEILNRFTAAIPLDEIEGRGGVYLASLLGWSGTAAHKNSHHSVPNPTKPGRQLTTRPPTLGERSIRLLRELNQCDLRLFHEATHRFTARLNQTRGVRNSARHRQCVRRRVGLQCPDDRGMSLNYVLARR